MVLLWQALMCCSRFVELMRVRKELGWDWWGLITCQSLKTVITSTFEGKYVRVQRRRRHWVKILTRRIISSTSVGFLGYSRILQVWVPYLRSRSCALQRLRLMHVTPHDRRFARRVEFIPMKNERLLIANEEIKGEVMKWWVGMQETGYTCRELRLRVVQADWEEVRFDFIPRRWMRRYSDGWRLYAPMVLQLRCTMLKASSK